MSRRRFDDLDEDSVDEHVSLTQRPRVSRSSNWDKAVRFAHGLRRVVSLELVLILLAALILLWSGYHMISYLKPASSQGSETGLGAVSSPLAADAHSANAGASHDSSAGRSVGVMQADHHPAAGDKSHYTTSSSASTPVLLQAGREKHLPSNNPISPERPTFSLVEKHSRERANDVLNEERTKFCQWWDLQKKSLSMIARQVAGDIATFLLNLNFEFSEDQHEYIKQLEEWRSFVVSDTPPKPRYNADGTEEPSLFEPVPPEVRAKCKSKCQVSFLQKPSAQGDARVYQEVLMTHTYRQTLIGCMLCIQGHIHLHDKCVVRDESTHIARRLAPNRIREAFDRIYDHTEQHVPQVGPDATIEDLREQAEAKREKEPFFLGAGVGAAFAPYLSLLDTFTYAPEQLADVFPLPDRESQVDVPAFRDQTTYYAKHSRALKTDIDAGMGGGMGVQLICKPYKDAPPLLLMSSGGGGGRGFQMSVDPLHRPREATPLGRAKDIIHNRPVALPVDSHARKIEKERIYGKDFAKHDPECCNSQVHTCCGGKIQFEEEDDKDEGLQFRARGRSAQDQNDIRREVHAGMGGGGGIQVEFGPDPLTHQVRPDLDLSIGGGGGGGMSITHNSFTESHGSQKDADVNLPQNYAEFRKRLFRDILHCVAHSAAVEAKPELWLVGGGGLGLGVRSELLTPPGLTPQLVDADSTPQYQRFAKVSVSADAGMGFKVKIPPAWITSFPIPYLAPLKEHTPKLAEIQQQNQAQDHAPSQDTIPLFDSATALATYSAQCVEHCLDLQASPLPHQHSDVLSLHLHSKVTSSGTSSSHPLLYAHCVCPCLQKSFAKQHWASNMACTPLAIGTYDVASSGHVAVADVTRAPHSAKARSSLLPPVEEHHNEAHDEDHQEEHHS